MVIEWVLGVTAFFMGASVGSFLAVVADRFPNGASIVSERSHCTSCGRVLGPIDMVPVLSYLWLRGRCRMCGVSIPLHYWVVEAATGLIFVGIVFRGDPALGTVVLACATSLLVLIALIDYQRGLILNAFVLPAMVLALALSPFWNQMGHDRIFLDTPLLLGSFLNSVVAGAGAFLFFLVVYLIYPKGMGGGDVKYAGLIGVLVGYPGVFVALWSAIVIGGLLSVALLALRLRGRKDAIPFGPFLSLGAVLALLATDQVVSRYQNLFA